MRTGHEERRGDVPTVTTAQKDHVRLVDDSQKRTTESVKIKSMC